MVNKQRAYDGGLILEVSGELDHHSAPKIRDELDGAMAQNNFKELTFDLTGLTFMDSSGIGVLLGRYKKLQALGVRVWLKGANPSIDKLLRMSGMYSIMPKVDRG